MFGKFSDLRKVIIFAEHPWHHRLSYTDYLVKVNVVSLESPQTFLYLMHDVTATQANIIWTFTKAAPHFGGNDILLSLLSVNTSSNTE